MAQEKSDLGQIAPKKKLLVERVYEKYISETMAASGIYGGCWFCGKVFGAGLSLTLVTRLGNRGVHPRCYPEHEQFKLQRKDEVK